MSADAGDSSAPNLNLSPDEKRVYGQLFRQADTDSVGVVTGEIAVKFFERTRLDSGVLGRIWQIADKENRGFLTPAGFSVALRLIGHGQAGREPTPEIALQTGPLPRFDGFVPQGQPPQSAGSPPPAGHIQAQGTGGGVRIPPLTPEKVAQFTGLFERQPLQGNVLPGDQARQIFDKSGLPNEVLSKIWELADTEQRGALVQTEFIIAMHLLTSMKIGAMRSLPNILPAALYEAATLRGPAAAPRQSPNNTGMSPIPRQMSGSAMQRTGSPLGRTPTIPVQHSGAASDWAVTPADKARFDQIYADIDKTNKGYIVGEEAVPFLSQSGLPEDTLAQIWDLADFNSQGQLTREGFAIAMYLIRQQRSGRSAPLPNTLPANLVPPSMRNQQRQLAATSAFDAPPPSQAPPTQPKPPPKSALDDLFGLESTSSSPAPPAPAQVATATGSNLNDPFAGSSSPVAPSSPTRAPAAGTSFKPFVPSSSFGRGLTTQGTGDSQSNTQQSSQQSWQASNNDDLLSDNDPDASKNISGESTDLANLSHQVGSLSKQMQDTQAKRSNTQNELNQTNSQKANFEQRLAQLRTLYEKEASDTRALEEQLRNSRSDTKKLQGECMTLEGTYRDAQAQHQEMLANLQADQKENTDLRERIRVINGEIAQLKPQIEKLKSDARQQRGLVAINKKQLSTVEGERDKLKNEAADLAKAAEEAPRQTAEASSGSTPVQVASPTLSTASGNNPFFRRTASTDIMGAMASPPARTFSGKSFDDVFGPSPVVGGTSTPPPPATSFMPQTTGTSTASAASSSTAPISSAQAPPAPPESGQITSSFLPLPDHSDSLTSSRQVSPPASRAEGSGNDASNPFPGPSPTVTSNLPGAFPSDVEQKETPAATPVTAEAEKATAGEEAKSSAADSFDPADQTKAKADFDNAFAAFTTANKEKSSAPAEPAKPPAAFDSEFPPISELDRDESDSDSEGGGFDDDFAPHSPRRSSTVPKPPPKVDETADKSTEQPSSPATIIAGSSEAHKASTVDDIFGAAHDGTEPSTSKPVPSMPPAQAAAPHDDLDDDFEGLEDAKEGSADDDFANISRSGLDDYNPVFDSSPPGSQTKSESTAFGNESSFDFIPSNSSTGIPAPSSGNQQKGAADNHDWDAIFAGLDSPSTSAAPGANEAEHEAPAAPPKTEPGVPARPSGPGRALTEAGEHDDPILKNLTGMGYSRADAVSALEKYDYNLERAANYLASQS